MDMRETFQELFSTLSKGSDFDPSFILDERDRTNERGVDMCKKNVSLYLDSFILSGEKVILKRTKNQPG